ncbi:cytochrome P450 [Xylaria bambusicola]|uniref:cytochrome P450 n=1 Tax=Xylaria bambusicola TaxID=326684 RepID=UPI002008A0B2|nr:cytochrome P450 [Xylaria bambusicola]KAI0508715.1 cytochrome P450 [Xylaria bambusicola]
MARNYGLNGEGLGIPIICLPVFVAALVIALYLRAPDQKEPPSLPERIPFISNGYQYLTNVSRFMDRVKETLEKNRSNIIKFYIGPTRGYIVTGTKNVQALLGSPHSLGGDWLQIQLMDKHWEMTKSEIQKFVNDKSGRLETPAPGSERVPESQRYWLGHQRLYVEFLTQQRHCQALADGFYRFFDEKTDLNLQEFETVSLFSTLKLTMTESATLSFFGSRILELNSGFSECYWAFDPFGGKLVWGLPKWLDPVPYLARARLHRMTRRYVDSAWKNLNPGASDADWDPHWGSRLSRETAKWLRAAGFSDKALAGHVLGTLFGLHGNTVPITTWILIELIKDQSLMQDARAEVLEAFAFDANKGRRFLNPQKLTSQPLLQSIYTEILRLHVSFTISREAMRPVEIDGYKIPSGSLVQSSSNIAHFDESVWGTEEHPASEFWAERHIKYADADGEVGKRQFSMRGRPTSFFPYGGGYVVCPGRHFAKQEILIAVALFITKFDIELVEWTNMNGTKSDREAHDDQYYAGVIAMPPDRDMKVRLKKTQGLID